VRATVREDKKKLAQRRYVCDVETPIRVDPRNLSWVLLAASAISSLYARTNAHSAPRRTSAPRTAPASASPALLADQALCDARLALSIIIVYVVRIITAVSANLTGVELAPAPIVRFYLVTLTESITSAVGVAVPAAERRDEARFDSRLGFAVVLCERPSEKDPKNNFWRRGATYATSNVPSALTREILPGYFLLRPLRDGIDQ